MAAVKRAYTSSSAVPSSGKRNAVKSPNSAVLGGRYVTVVPSVETTVPSSVDNEKTPSHATAASASNRCRSGISGFDRMNHPPWLMWRRGQKIIPTSANTSGVFSAPRSLVTYLQLCRPLVPKIRTDCPGQRMHNPFLHNKIHCSGPCTKGDSDLMVYGVPFSQSNQCQKNLQQKAEKVQLHVYLPCEGHSGTNSTRLQSEEEEVEAASKLTKLSLQDC